MAKNNGKKQHAYYARYPSGRTSSVRRVRFATRVPFTRKHSGFCSVARPALLQREPSLCTQPEMVIIAGHRLPVLNSIQDLDDVREGGIWVERELSSPAPSLRHVILNLIQDPLARADAQVGSFCGI